MILACIAGGINAVIHCTGRPPWRRVATHIANTVEQFMSSKKTPLIIASMLLAAANVASADGGAYVGLRAGSELDSRFNHSAIVNADTPIGIYGGWNFNDQLGVELGYTDLGRSTAPGIADFGFDVDGNLLTGGLTYRHSISESADLFGGVGLFDLNEDGTAITIAGPVSFNNDDNGFYAEVGGRYRFNERLALRASYQWFDFGSTAASDSDGTVMLGLELDL